jgi:glycolate oxidase
VVKDYVLNLEVVLPSGEIIWTGANVLKNSTGYNLTQLMVGSEGTLGFVTKIVLKLIPLPKYDLLMLVPFVSLEKASEAVSAIFRAGFTPSGLELVEIDALKIVSKMVDSHAVPVTDDIAAHLIVEVDGNDLDVLMKDMEAIAELMVQYEGGEVFLQMMPIKKQNCGSFVVVLQKLLKLQVIQLKKIQLYQELNYLN